MVAYLVTTSILLHLWIASGLAAYLWDIKGSAQKFAWEELVMAMAAGPIGLYLVWRSK